MLSLGGRAMSGASSHDQLQTFLAPHGYQPCPITPGLWKHDTQPLSFTLVVDDFAIKYTNKVDATHLMDSLKKHKVTEDWEVSCYCGLTLNWDYLAWTVDLPMPGYIDQVLK